MDDLTKILQDRAPRGPEQVTALKKYVNGKYQVNITVLVTNKHYLIKVPGAAIAHRLRVDTLEIKKICNLDKPLVINIGY